jgi:drug/metabolite transporter (DMT)-like permease
MSRTTIPLTTGAGLRLALLTALISGVAIWLNSAALKQVPDATLYTTLKNLVAALLMTTASLAWGGVAEARSLTRATWLRLLLIGVIGGSIPFLLFFGGLAMASAPGAAFIHKTLFIWVALLAVPFLGERPGFAQVGALAILLVGQLLLAPPRVEGASFATGEAMILAATLLWSVEVVVARRLLGSGAVSPGLAGAARLGFGVVLLLAYAAISGALAGVSALTAGVWAWVVLTGIVLAAYVGTWFAALRRAPASAVTAVLVVGALVTAGLQALSEGALPGPAALLGGALLVLASMVVAWTAVRDRDAVTAKEAASGA